MNDVEIFNAMVEMKVRELSFGSLSWNAERDEWQLQVREDVAVDILEEVAQDIMDGAAMRLFKAKCHSVKITYTDVSVHVFGILRGAATHIRFRRFGERATTRHAVVIALKGE